MVDLFYSDRWKQGSPPAGGSPPAFFRIGGCVHECSIFVDETGETGKRASRSEYYGVAMVFHEQDEEVLPIFAEYERKLSEKHLKNIPMHTESLLSGTGDYRDIAPLGRQQMLNAFLLMIRRLPISYAIFMYKQSDFRDRDTGELDAVKLGARLRRDITGFLQDHLTYSQKFNKIKRYYDNGQKVVLHALDSAILDVFSKETIEAKPASQVDYRLAQVADFICTIELTAHNYEEPKPTNTDLRFFKKAKDFRKNFYRVVRKLTMQ